jgi:hypothetical protein
MAKIRQVLKDVGVETAKRKRVWGYDGMLWMR